MNAAELERRYRVARLHADVAWDAWDTADEVNARDFQIRFWELNWKAEDAFCAWRIQHGKDTGSPWSPT